MSPISKETRKTVNILELIELYKKYDFLWNMKNPLHKRVDIKKQAYIEISKQLKLNVECVKRKINSIRATYLHERKKVLRSAKINPRKIYKPTLFWYDRMAFLNDSIKLRKKFFNGQNIQETPKSATTPANHQINSNYNDADAEFKIDSEDEVEEPDEDEEEIYNENDDYYNDTENNNDQYSSYENGRTNKINGIIDERTKTDSTNIDMDYDSFDNDNNDNNINNELPTLPLIEIQTKNNVSKENEIYGQLIAAQLENLPPFLAIQAMRDIQEVLTNYRLSTFSDM